MYMLNNYVYYNYVQIHAFEVHTSNTYHVDSIFVYIMHCMFIYHENSFTVEGLWSGLENQIWGLKRFYGPNSLHSTSSSVV